MAHSDEVSELSWGGTRLASAGGKQVCVWSSSGALEWQAEADKYTVNHVLAHSSGRIVTSGAFGTVNVFDATGTLVQSSTDERMLPGRLFELADGRVAVGYDEYEDLRLLDLDTGAFEELEAQGEQGPSIAVRERGGQLFSLGTSAGMVSWNLGTKAFVARIEGPEGEPLGFVGETLAFSTTAKGAAIWQTSDGNLLHEIAIADVRAGSASADGKRLAMHCKEGVVVVDVASGKQERLLAYGPFPRLTSFSPDGTLLAVIVDGGGKSSLKVFEVATGKDLGGWDGSVRVRSIYFSPGLLLLGKADGNIERLEM
jgi:hypothetical protein